MGLDSSLFFVFALATLYLLSLGERNLQMSVLEPGVTRRQPR